MHLDQIAAPAWAWNCSLSLDHSLARLALAFALITTYFAAIIAICQPRYLPLFCGVLHLHLPA
jgi:hypothetical protein